MDSFYCRYFLPFSTVSTLLTTLLQSQSTNRSNCMSSASAWHWKPHHASTIHGWQILRGMLMAALIASHGSVSYKVASLLPSPTAMLWASLQHDPDVEGAGQSHPSLLMQCFCLPSVVVCWNVLVSRYLWPKSTADTLSITIFKSIGDNSIDVSKVLAIGDKLSPILDTSILTSLSLRFGRIVAVEYISFALRSSIRLGDAKKLLNATWTFWTRVADKAFSPHIHQARSLSCFPTYISNWNTCPVVECTHALYPCLIGFIGIYCLRDDLPLNGIMALSTDCELVVMHWS